MQLGGGRGDGGYEEVVVRAESLFNKIRASVAQQTAPTTLKSAVLHPLRDSLALDVHRNLSSWLRGR
jgi:hypothetical protein